MEKIGKWLNLVEHLVWDQGVAGSNPVFPTMRYLKTSQRSPFFYISNQYLPIHILYYQYQVDKPHQ